MILSIGNIIIDGLILSIAVSIVVVGSLAFNPRLWLQDAPADLRARVAPMTPTEKRHRVVVMVFFFTIIVVVMYSTLTRVHLDNDGSPDFWALFLTTWGVLMIFNLFDAVILDYVLLTVIRPKFARIPGVGDLTETSENLYWMHVRDFLKGCVIVTITSGVIAGLVAVL